MAYKLSGAVDTSGMEKAIKKELEAFSKLTLAEIKDAIDEAAKETVAELRVSSPKKTGAYAKAWKARKESVNGIEKATVYNDGKYYLTHLLENGHASRNHAKRVPPHEHIAKAEEKAANLVVEKIRKKLEGGE